MIAASLCYTTDNGAPAQIAAISLGGCFVLGGELRYISTFSGIEAASVAWEPLGWEPIAFCEIDEFPLAVLASRYPNVPNLGDITKVNWGKVVEQHGRPDVLVGGSPCQSFSVAGGRESLGGESRLVFEYIRALAEIQPTWFLWENVPGVLNTRDNAFAQLLGALSELGYGLAWRVLDAQFFGVAQRRRRVFLVGHLGAGGGAAAVLFESESVRGNTQTSKQKREELARAAGRDAAARCGDGNSLTPWDVQSKRIFQEDGTVAGTLGSSGSAKGQGIQFVMTNYGVEIAGTLTRRADSSPCTDRGQNIVCQPFVGGNGGNTCMGLTEDCSPTMTAKHPVDVLCMASGQANAEVTEDSSDAMAETIHDGSKWVVRRITPTEAERLQGFPDGWTDVPYKGKDHPPDTPRYKAIGNSMAVPVMRWIGERIQMVDEIIKSMKM